MMVGTWVLLDDELRMALSREPGRSRSALVRRLLRQHYGIETKG
jgi:hypothetical protein